MKTIILAAGVGSRMLPLTLEKHKCILEINDKPIIKHQTDILKKMDVFKIAIVTGYREDDIKNCLKNEVKYYFNPFYETTNSVVSLWLAKEFLDDDLLIINSDVIFDETLINEFLSNKSDICVAVSKEWSPERGYKVEIINEQIVNMSMNIDLNNVGGEYAGMIKVSKKIIPLLIEKMDFLMKQKQFNIWFEDMIVELIKDGANADYITVNPNLWYEIDTVEELEYAREKFKKI